MKKFTAILMAAVMLVSCAAFAACSDDKEQDDTKPSESQPTEQNSDSSDSQDVELMDLDVLHDMYPGNVKKDTEHSAGYQLEMPQEGDEIAIIRTSKGDITLRLFPENAPNTVENFVELAKAGKYDNVLFHRVIDDFMIQTGDYENGDGTGGQYYKGGAFDDEFCDKLFNIRGAVAMANSGRDTNGSQFFINQRKAESTPSWAELQASWDYIYEGLSVYYAQDALIGFVAYYGSNCLNPARVPDDVKKLYEENGGNPNLDGAFNEVDRGHTVFAQVIDGMDVVDEIAAVQTDDNAKPLEDIIIKTVEITSYSGN